MAKPILLHSAAELLQRILSEKMPADRQMEGYFRTHRNMGVRDRGFVAETVNGCLREKRWLEYIAGNSLLLDVVATYLLTHGYSARALEETGFRGDARGMVERARTLDKAALPFAIQANMPDWLAGRLGAQFGDAETLGLLLGLMLEPKRQEMVVDFCAGAGGKTLHLGALMANSGTVYAFDVLAKRLDRLKPRLRRAGLNNVRMVTISHERDTRVQRLKGKIDRVLVDAPCSGTGTMRRNPDIKWRDINLAELMDPQQRILAAAAELLKPGGRLVYATCSLLKEENDDIVEKFLSAHPEFNVVPAGEILTRRHVPLTMNNAALRLYPHRHRTDGFYAVALEKLQG